MNPILRQPLRLKYSEWRREPWVCLDRNVSGEFKMATVRRLETGFPIVEAARTCDLHLIVLQRWSREGPGGNRGRSSLFREDSVRGRLEKYASN